MSPETARPNRDEVAALAYELWLARGCPEGSPEADWMQAEQRLRNSGSDSPSLAA